MEKKLQKNISYILQFIDSTKFITSSLLNLFKNLSEGIHKTKGNYGRNDGKWKICGSKYKVCDCFLEYTNFKDDLLGYKCFYCNKNYQ